VSDQQNPPVLQATLQGGGIDPVAASGAGTPAGHFANDQMVRDVQLTVKKIDTEVQTLMSTINSLVTEVAAIHSQVTQIQNGLDGMARLEKLPNGISLGEAVQQILQKVTQ
jgi:hypothetical protein